MNVCDFADLSCRAIYRYRETPWFENFKWQVRQYTDKLYPWGMTKMDNGNGGDADCMSGGPSGISNE